MVKVYYVVTENFAAIQMGVMSPTKLRMKLLGSHGGSIGKADEAKKSPRASPARLDADEDDDDHPKNSLLPQELDEGSIPLWSLEWQW